MVPCPGAAAAVLTPPSQYEGDDGEFCAEALDDFFIIGERRLCEWHARKTQAALEKRSGGRSRVKATRRQTILQTLR